MKRPGLPRPPRGRPSAAPASPFPAPPSSEARLPPSVGGHIMWTKCGRSPQDTEALARGAERGGRDCQRLALRAARSRAEREALRAPHLCSASEPSATGQGRPVPGAAQPGGQPPCAADTPPRGWRSSPLPPVKALDRLQMTPLLGSPRLGRPGRCCYAERPRRRERLPAGASHVPAGLACGLLDSRRPLLCQACHLHGGTGKRQGRETRSWFGMRGRGRARTTGFFRVSRMGRGEGSPESDGGGFRVPPDTSRRGPPRSEPQTQQSKGTETGPTHGHRGSAAWTRPVYSQCSICGGCC